MQLIFVESNEKIKYNSYVFAKLVHEMFFLMFLARILTSPLIFWQEKRNVYQVFEHIHLHVSVL